MTSKLEGLFALQVLALRLPQPVREYAFGGALGRRWKMDFAWPEARVCIEIQGGTWMPAGGGRHSRGAGYEADAEKLSAAALLGWKCLVATSSQVQSGIAAAWVEHALRGSGDLQALFPCPKEAATRKALARAGVRAARLMAPNQSL